MGWEALEQWGDDVARIEPLAGGVANDVWSVRVNGHLAVGRLGARSAADLAWETELLQHLDREGLTVPVPIPTRDGRLFVDGVVVMTYVEGGPPGTEADLGTMPPEGVARCRAAWARLVGRPTCVVHGDPNNLGNVRMTADRVALIDWDESHVDVPDLDLALPHNAAGLDDGGVAPRVLLIGMMAAGKTSVGHALATLTGWPYLDNDELVRRATGQPTPDVLASADEATLRRAESAALDEALAAEPPIIAGVAAGVIADAGARHRMGEGAFVVYLRAPVSVLAERVGAGAGRPWLGDDPTTALERLYEGREPLYQEVADLVLDSNGASPEALAARIADALGR